MKKLLFASIFLLFAYISLPYWNPSSESQAPEQFVDFLRPLDPPSVDSGIEGIDCIYVINLDERPERWETVKKQFDRQHINPYRVSAINGWKIPKAQALQLVERGSDYLKRPFRGVLGCLLSHLSVYKDALEREFNTVWICEDDIEFKQSANKISPLLQQLSQLDPEWDVLYTDYSLKEIKKQSPPPGQDHYLPIHYSLNENLQRTHGRLNTHSMLFSKRGLQKVYAYFTSRRLWNPIDVDIHYVPTLREYTSTEDIVTSIYDSSLVAHDGSSDTQPTSFLNRKK